MLESAKEGVAGLSEGSDIGLGPRGREFESRHSDQVKSYILTLTAKGKCSFFFAVPSMIYLIKVHHGGFCYVKVCY